MTAHHRHSPSGAEAWFKCPGMLNKSDGLPDHTSEFASEGTAMHTLRERCLTTGADVQDFVGEWIEADGLRFEVTSEWVNWLQPGIDRIREAKGFEWLVEQRIEMDPWIPGGFGTLDTLGISKDLIIIDDFKGGRGIIVPAERNKQLMIYALGAWQNYARHRTKAKRFLLRIDQPRAPGQGDEWETTLDELLEFADELVAAVERTLDPNAPLVPGPVQCQFCRAAKNLRCEALDEFVLELLGLTPADLDLDFSEKPELITTDTLNPHRRSYVLQHAQMISSWVNNLKASALKDALDGEEVPGFKAVATEGDRAWVSEQQAEEFWKGKMPDKDLYIKKLKSPAQMERIAGTRNWAKAQELIHRPEGKPALVPESDKRPALIPLMNLLDDLDDMDGEGLDDLIGNTAEEDTFDELI